MVSPTGASRWTLRDHATPSTRDPPSSRPLRSDLRLPLDEGLRCRKRLVIDTVVALGADGALVEWGAALWWSGCGAGNSHGPTSSMEVSWRVWGVPRTSTYRIQTSTPSLCDFRKFDEFLGCSKTVGAGKLTKDQQSKTSLFIAVRMEYLMCTNIVSKHMFSAESHPEGPVCPVHGPGPRPHSSFLSLVLTKATHQ